MFIEILLIEIGTSLILGGVGIYVAKIIANAIKEHSAKEVQITTPEIHVISGKEASTNSLNTDINTKDFTKITLQENRPISSSIKTSAKILNEASK